MQYLSSNGGSMYPQTPSPFCSTGATGAGMGGLRNGASASGNAPDALKSCTRAWTKFPKRLYGSIVDGFVYTARVSESHSFFPMRHVNESWDPHCMRLRDESYSYGSIWTDQSKRVNLLTFIDYFRTLFRAWKASKPGIRCKRIRLSSPQLYRLTFSNQ